MRTLLVTSFVALALAGCAKLDYTGEKAPADEPVAIVNGKKISRNTFDFYLQGALGKPAAEATEEERKQALDSLIRGELVAADAERSGVARQPETRAILELSRLQVLQQASMAGAEPTDEELRAEYDTQVKSLGGLEYRARHILVDDQALATQITAQLKQGARFEDLARRHSKDPSGATGGDLGWFTANRMVPEFSAAVQALKPGETTAAPVQTQYGWHVVRVEETRALQPPPFEQVRDRLVQMVQSNKFRTKVEALEAKASIEKRL
ncbi:MAG: hypothetical protein RL026_2671 [Pseudomonadota bacterium]|jgi:peptidyl-prolyl cis-trans isomerase C